MNKKILNHFRINDPVLHSYALQVELSPIKRDSPKNYFYRLCREIVRQQLSDKAGEAIFGRFQKLFPNGLVTTLDTLSISHERLRASGMFMQKPDM
jgi:3-methyladenine DNA glycosylase/8-oxoguanine DNA glycosylase